MNWSNHFGLNERFCFPNSFEGNFSNFGWCGFSGMSFEGAGLWEAGEVVTELLTYWYCWHAYSPATCYQNPENPSCIDLILTNNPNSFQNSGVIETGLSDFHKMTVTVVKTTFEKLKPKIIHCKDYTKFSNDKFREYLISCLSTLNIRVDCNGMWKFLQICIKALNELALQKKKYSTGKNMPFINKTVKKSFYDEKSFEKYISQKPFR